jgi:agmatine deiminase
MEGREYVRRIKLGFHQLCAKLIVLFLIAHYVQGQTVTKKNGDEFFTIPAEFEKQEAVWIAAKPFESGHPTIEIVIQMLKALSPHVKIKLMVADNAAKETVQKLLKENGVDEKQVFYWTTVSSPTRWYRDVGGLFLKSDKGNLKIVDFGFNCYGDCESSSEKAKRKEGIDREIAALLGLPAIKSDLVSEGGDLEFNGRGTMMAVEAVELQRNPHLTKAQIEKELLRVLGQKKIIWLKKGIAEDDKAQRGALYENVYPIGTGGHVDEFCRFISPDTILLAEVSPRERDADPVMKMTYDRMEENYKILRASSDQTGKKFKIIRVPVADIIYDEFVIKEGDTEELNYFRDSKPGQTIKSIIAASYLNFFISNGVVLQPAYWREGRPNSTKVKDEAVRKVLQKAFPNRKIVPISAENLNYGGGGMHCATQPQPAV